MAKKQPTYEELFTQLEQVVAALESGDLSLEATLRAYQQGMDLAKQCQQQLDAAQLQIQVINNGTISSWQEA